ncbi:MAG: CvpA family protein [Treponema sp.]|nr:CvpA family protein [Treponema sp.]
MMISLLDVILAVVVFYFAVSAARNGLLKEVFGKLAVILGVVFGVYFCGLLSPYIRKTVDFPILDYILAFMLIFAGVFLLVKIVQIILGGFLKGEILGSLNHALGFFFGFFEGMIIVCSVLIILNAQPWVDVSRLVDNSGLWQFLRPALSPSVEFVSSRIVK